MDEIGSMVRLIRKAEGPYFPEADRVNQGSQLGLVGSQNIFDGEAVSAQVLHGTERHLVFGLAGQHQRHQHLEAAYLEPSRKKNNRSGGLQRLTIEKDIRVSSTANPTNHP